MKGVENVIIPNGFTIIDDYAFYDCSSLMSITIPDGVTSIGDWAFNGCSNLTSITMPDGVTSIGDYTFYKCSSLTSITIPDSITSIGNSAFYSCSNLTSIIIPAKVEYIASDTFALCVNIKEFTIDKDNPNFTAIDGVIYNKELTKPVIAIQGVAKNVVIPETVTYIGDTFSGCKSLESITIPDSVTSIGNGAFYGCSGLTSITIPDSVTNIGWGAFRDCGSLASITIPDSVTSINDWAFSDCNSLKSINIPDSVISIGYGAFFRCKDLTSITLPDSVTSIGDSAFSGCDNLESVTIGKGVTRIDSDAFLNCFGLMYIYNNSDLSLTFGSKKNGYIARYALMIINKDGSVKTSEELIETPDGFLFEKMSSSIYRLRAYNGDADTVTLPLDINGHSYSIYKMKGVENVIIPNGFTTIGDYAFDGCRSLKSITIPDSVKSIGYYAFRNTGIYYNPDNWDNGNFYIDKCLVVNDKSVKYMDLRPDTKRVLTGYNTVVKFTYGNCICGTNVESTVIWNKDIDSALSILTDTDRLPITFKNCIIAKNSTVVSSSAFADITGITIWVEANEKDCRWDENYPSWNNGNKVVYGEDWAYSDFYDVDGKLIFREPRLNSNVIIHPYYRLEDDAQYEYKIGWDLDEDGIEDAVPATSTNNISAHAIITERIPINSKEQFVPGDINGDESVNNKDVVALFKYVSGGEVTTNEIALDVNGDGLVNNKDVVALFKYVSGGDIQISDKPYNPNAKAMMFAIIPERTKVY